MRTVFGPKSKKTLYLDRLQELADSDYFDEWRTNEEVMWKVNEVVPARWTQLHSCGVHKYMRKIKQADSIWKINTKRSWVREYDIGAKGYKYFFSKKL